VIGEHAGAGIWAISLGAPAHNPSGPHRHDATDYVDTPTRLFWIDFDGAQTKGLGTADKFEDAAQQAVSWLGKTFKNVTWLALRTTRTGSNENGIFIRLLFLLKAPATLAQMSAFTIGLSELPELKQGIVNPRQPATDINLHTRGHFVFITPPLRAPGVIEPADDITLLIAYGDALDLDAAAKNMGVDLTNVSAERTRGRTPRGTIHDQQRISPIAPGLRNQELLTALVRSIPNKGKFDNRGRAEATKGEGSYIGMGHATFGACSSEAPEFGRGLWLEWTASWNGPVDPEEDARVWDTLDPNGLNGFWDLMDYAREFGGAAGLKARRDILIDIFPEMNTEQVDDLARNHVGEIPEWVTEMNKEYAFSKDRPDGVIVRGDDTFIIRMITRQALRNIFANDLIRIPGGKNKDGTPKVKLINRGDAWFLHRARAQYRTVGVYPIGQEPPGALNLWTGLAVAPRPGKWPKLKEFLLGTTCNGEQAAFDYLLKLMQWKIQNPTENPEVGTV
jgi:hypothetical protein